MLCTKLVWVESKCKRDVGYPSRLKLHNFYNCAAEIILNCIYDHNFRQTLKLLPAFFFGSQRQKYSDQIYTNYRNFSLNMRQLLVNISPSKLYQGAFLNFNRILMMSASILLMSVNFNKSSQRVPHSQVTDTRPRMGGWVRGKFSQKVTLCKN